MTVIVSGQHRTAWFGLGFIFFVIWSLYTLNISSVSSVGSTIYDDFIETQEQTVDAAASIAFGTEDSTTSLVTASTLTLTGQTPSNLADESSDTALLLSEIPLILFAYSESETARVNIEFFIRHGLHAAADFIFILNGATDIASIIPKEFNIRVVQRENDCYDIGAYAEVLTKDDLYKGYKRFIMLNASLRGPFIPYWAKGCWSDMYLGRITDEVKLVGMTANCWPTFHVQSMIWATDIIGLTALLFPTPAALSTYALNPPASADLDLERAAQTPPQIPGINHCFHSWITAVTAEVGASSLIRAAGYKLDVMMSAYHGIENYEEQCDSSENGDVLRDKKYFGTNVHPFETVFVKTNREVDPVGFARLAEWVDGRGYSSYEFCKAMDSPWIEGGSV